MTSLGRPVIAEVWHDDVAGQLRTVFAAVQSVEDVDALAAAELERSARTGEPISSIQLTRSDGWMLSLTYATSTLVWLVLFEPAGYPSWSLEGPGEDDLPPLVEFSSGGTISDERRDSFIPTREARAAVAAFMINEDVWQSIRWVPD